MLTFGDINKIFSGKHIGIKIYPCTTRKLTEIELAEISRKYPSTGKKRKKRPNYAYKQL